MDIQTQLSRFKLFGLTLRHLESIGAVCPVIDAGTFSDSFLGRLPGAVSSYRQIEVPFLKVQLGSEGWGNGDACNFATGFETVLSGLHQS